MYNPFNHDIYEDKYFALKAEYDRQKKAENADLSNLTLGQSIENFFTGNYTYRREKELTDMANAFSAQQAQIARDYDTEMSNTAYQRKVADMQAAGINPYADLGSGAQVVASPSPSAYTAHTNSDSRGFGALASLLGRSITGAFVLANTALKSKGKQNISAANSAYETQYFNKYGHFTGSTVKRSI